MIALLIITSIPGFVIFYSYEHLILNNNIYSLSLFKNKTLLSLEMMFFSSLIAISFISNIYKENDILILAVKFCTIISCLSLIPISLLCLSNSNLIGSLPLLVNLCCILFSNILIQLVIITFVKVKKQSVKIINTI